MRLELLTEEIKLDIHWKRESYEKKLPVATELEFDKKRRFLVWTWYELLFCSFDFDPQYMAFRKMIGVTVGDPIDFEAPFPYRVEAWTEIPVTIDLGA